MASGGIPIALVIFFFLKQYFIPDFKQYKENCEFYHPSVKIKPFILFTKMRRQFLGLYIFIE